MFWRRLRLGLPTLLGLQRRGWFIPYRYAATLPATGGSPPYAAIETLFAGRHASFEAVLEPDYPALFIRAPRIRRVGAGVEVLARWKGEPVFVREGRVFAATFHPELSDDRRVLEVVLGAA